LIIYDLNGEDCVKEQIYNILEVIDPIFFFAMGHGAPDAFTDNNEEIVWQCGENSCYLPPTNLKGRIVYLWSCLTARELGPKIIEYGAISYIGYNEEWAWVSSTTPAGDPYNDPYAACFFDSASEIIRALVDGCTVGQAVQKSIDKYNAWISYWEQSEDIYASEIIKWLIWDRDALTQLGDTEARLIPPDKEIGIFVKVLD